MRSVRKTASLILSLIMIVTMMPFTSFAEDGEGTVDNSGDTGYAEFTFSDGIAAEDIEDIEGADFDQLMEDFFSADDSSLSGTRVNPTAPLSVKGDRLKGNDLKFYNNYKTIIKRVSAGKTTSAVKRVKVSKILGKRKFTARQLGVKRIGYKRNGKWYITNAAQKKINALVSAGSWKKVIQGLLCDLSSQSYWVDWYSDKDFINYKCPFHYTTNTITFDRSDWIEFCLPVMPEFAKAKNSAYNYVYKVDSRKIKGAAAAKKNARAVVRTFDNAIPTTFAESSAEEIDYARMWYYCRVIADINTYDTYAASLSESERYWCGPWSMIYVFDDDPNTNAVCAGYARAFKYLCELSDFESKWIDCQLASGSAGGNDSSHMWNIVRMNDGLNYVVDPTWIDDDTNNTADPAWFMRGDPYSTANSFTIENNHRVYDAWTKAVFAPAERILSPKSSYEFLLNGDRPVKLKKTAITRRSGKKRSIRLKWKKMSTPLGALYIDGYQIQYGTSKSFRKSKTKTIKVKGYNRTTKTIKKLKRRRNYYVRIRTYAKVGNKTYYSKWSKRKKVRTK